MTQSADTWPVTVGVQYYADGPALLCDAYVHRTIITGSVITEQCGTAIHGTSLDELRRSLQEHINHVQHVPR